MPRSPLTCSIALSFIAFLTAPFVSGASDESRPNFLIILADDLGYGDVQCYNPERGKIPTPQMDKLAAQGMRFTDGHSSSAGCTPSRYSLLTGRYDLRNRMEGVGVFGGFGGPPLIPKNRLTIASLAKQRGYRTACVGKWHVGWQWPIENADRALLGTQTLNALTENYTTPEITKEQQAAWQRIFSQPIAGGPTALGFDHYFGIDVAAWPPFCLIENGRTISVPSRLLPARDLPRDVSIAASQGPADKDWKFVSVMPEMAKRACETIAGSLTSRQPFLLYLPLPAPHQPWAVSDEWRGKSGLGTYADWVMQLDATVGQVLDALERSGAARNTLVLLASDNGFAGYTLKELNDKGHFPSGPLRGLKAQPYEGGHREPFIVRWPAVVKPGSVCDQLVLQTDIFATIADILSVKVPDDAGEDSFSFLPLLQGKGKPVREHAINSSGQGAYALRRGDWKLIVDTAGKIKPGTQLYNLAKDLGERNNLAVQEPERVAEMRALLLKLIQAGRSTPGAPQRNDGRLLRFASGK